MADSKVFHAGKIEHENMHVKRMQVDSNLSDCCKYRADGIAPPRVALRPDVPASICIALPEY